MQVICIFGSLDLYPDKQDCVLISWATAAGLTLAGYDLLGLLCCCCYHLCQAKRKRRPPADAAPMRRTVDASPADAAPPAPVAAPPPSSAFDSWASSRTADFEESNQPPRSPGRETGWLRDMNSTLGASTVGRGDFSAVRV